MSARRKGRIARALERSGFVRFARDEAGNSTIEFAILFPVFMTLFISAFEMGLLMTRHVLLERSLDMSVRAVRLGTENPVGVNDLKRMICTGAGIIPDCMTNVKVEMKKIDPRLLTNIPVTPDCVDRNNPALPLRNFATGSSNELMILRVCALYDPFFPTNGLGGVITNNNEKPYALVSSSIFVMEPIDL